MAAINIGNPPSIEMFTRATTAAALVKFDGSDYMQWKIHLDGVLTSAGLMPIIRTPLAIPLTPQQSAFAVNIILCALKPNIANQYSLYTDPASIVLLLENIYNPRTPAARAEARHQLYELKFPDDGTMEIKDFVERYGVVWLVSTKWVSRLLMMKLLISYFVHCQRILLSFVAHAN